MKRLAWILPVLGLLLLLPACGGGSDGPRQVFEAQLDMMDGLAASMEKASNADDVAAALNEACDRMEKILPRMQELMEKMPELKNAGGPNGALPEVLKDLEPRLKASAMKMVGAMMKAMPYIQDPKVQAAQKRFQELGRKPKK